MNTRRLGIAVLAMAATILSTAAQPQVSKFRLAEKAANDYMTARFEGDSAAVAALMHPETLERMRTQILNDAGGTLTPSDFNLSLSSDEMRALSPEALYVAIVEANRRRTPDATLGVQGAKVEVLDSREAPDGGIVVELRLLVPSDNGGFFAEEAEFLVRNSSAGWKVVADQAQQ